MKKILILFSLFIQTLNYAQNTEFGLMLGASVYTGDIEVSPANFAPQTSPAVGIFVRQHVSEKFAVRGLIAIGGVKADEKKYPTSSEREKRGFNFKGTVAELSILPEWRPFSLGNVHFLLFAGVNAIYVNPKSNFNDQSSSSSSVVLEDQSQKYPKIAVGIPIGGGLQWYINETTALGAELGMRKTFTDYLDGFSATTNPESKDYYVIGGITFSKFFSLGNDRAGTQRTRYKRRGVNCPSFN
ncbi:MAG: outer membrane beta-barrel protein [Saprospiraceae bacterium]|nr:outer membrane beta-barrel protein [Saprospiraceae bacterium]